LNLWKKQDNSRNQHTPPLKFDVTPTGDFEEAPLAVVIPVRDRPRQRLFRTLCSLNWQSAGRPAQVVIVSHGSRPESMKELGDLCREQDANMISLGHPGQPWNKPLALNTGIRATKPGIPFLMTMDSDMLLAPNFFAAALERLQQEPPALVLCPISDLPKNAHLPDSPEELRKAWPGLAAMSKLRKLGGSGAAQTARRSFYFQIRGYDEDMLWWGAMDTDIVNRARLLGMEIVWMRGRTAMLHQWHPRKHRILGNKSEIRQARRSWKLNHELMRARSQILLRNPQQWGGVVDDADF
jgi:hypothetical protein